MYVFPPRGGRGKALRRPDQSLFELRKETWGHRPSTDMNPELCAAEPGSRLGRSILKLGFLEKITQAESSTQALLNEPILWWSEGGFILFFTLWLVFTFRAVKSLRFFFPARFAKAGSHDFPHSERFPVLVLSSYTSRDKLGRQR